MDQLQRARTNEKGSLRLEITTLSLGANWCLLAMSHELLAHYQFQIEGLSPFDRTMVLAYTNGCESYIPSAFDLRTATESDYEAAPFAGAALCFPQTQSHCSLFRRRRGDLALVGSGIQGLDMTVAQLQRAREPTVHISLLRPSRRHAYDACLCHPVHFK